MKKQGEKMIGRTSELKYLNSFYEQNGSNLLVLYGQKDIGKTTILKEFTKGRPCHYHMARACSEKEQLLSFCRNLDINILDKDKKIMAGSFLEAFTIAAENDKSDKKILIIDEFQNMVKTCSRFMEELVSFVKSREEKETVLVILCSSSISWIENSMISKIGKAALSISGLYKVKELTFTDMRAYFPGFNLKESIEAYAILGGVPGLWKYFDDSLSIKENICRNILESTSPLHEEAQKCVTAELREASVYNTILAALASGKRKLNDLYNCTGFSRAKISVYLKNLMEREFVEKVFSYDSEGRNNTQKGIYRINSNYVDFYFNFLYHDGGKLFFMPSEEYYDSYIAPFFSKYTDGYFKKICMQNVEEKNRSDELPFHYVKMGEWVGKDGNIDLVAKDEKDNTLVGLCCWENPVMMLEDYNNLVVQIKKARMKADYIFLFAKEGFETDLENVTAVQKNHVLICSKEL